MKIIKTYGWNRRDFSYDAKCEHCDEVSKNHYGYDDSNYYDNVVPAIRCPKCGETTNSVSGAKKQVTAPRYDPNIVM